MVVLMDNLNLHCSDEVRTAIENIGAKLIFLPTYSPDLSPIELTIYSKSDRDDISYAEILNILSVVLKP
jgi:transposase